MIVDRNQFFPNNFVVRIAVFDHDVLGVDLDRAGTVHRVVYRVPLRLLVEENCFGGRTQYGLTVQSIDDTAAVVKRIGRMVVKQFDARILLSDYLEVGAWTERSTVGRLEGVGRIVEVFGTFESKRFELV